MYILTSPYPNAATKVFIPLTIDIGIIKFTNDGISTFKSIAINSDKYTISVELNASTNTIKISDYIWNGVDVSSSAKLMVSEILM